MTSIPSLRTWLCLHGLLRSSCRVRSFMLAAVFGTAMPADAQERSPDIARALTTNLAQQGRIMWVDGSANIARTTSLEGVRDIVARCKRANFTTIVVDVKPVVGQVLYASKIAERLRQWQGKNYPEFDVLAAFVDEGHKAGIEIAASFNVFSEGHKYYSAGLAYRNKEWQSTAYNVERSLVAGDGARLPIRAAEEPPEPGKTIVHGSEFILDPAPARQAKLAVALDGDSRVAGIIDQSLLGDEPLTAPEDGYMMLLDNLALSWTTAHLRAGGRATFEASGRRVAVTEAATEKVAAFVNPLHPEARAHEISLLSEVAKNYDVDAIVFDRMRFANVYNDYGDRSRFAFEKWLGKTVSRWPEDVMEFDPRPGEPPRRGRLFKPWLEFRARVIRDFVVEASDAIKTVKPRIQFGAYVGSWFTEYYDVGVNWASDKYPVKQGWATPYYNQAGYAEFLDWLSTGCYYPLITREEARAQGKEDGATVEAAADVSIIAVQNATPVYAGLYALDYAGRPDDFARALSVAGRRSQGVMVFDLSYIYNYGWWPILEKAFAQPADSPHAYPDITAELRSAQDASR